MKIAVSSSGKDLDSQLDPRFGRCAYFVIVETDDMSFEAFENKNAALGGGAGIQAAQFVVSKGAIALITGNCGPNAVQTLAAADVQLFVGQAGRIRGVVHKFKNGELMPTTEANAPMHAGSGALGVGRGRGMGRGSGRRQGMGGGSGSGR